MAGLDGLPRVEQSMMIYTHTHVHQNKNHQKRDQFETQKSNRPSQNPCSVAFKGHRQDGAACSIENVFEFIWYSKSFFVSHVVNIRTLSKIHVRRHSLQCYTAAQAFISYITNGFLSRR